MSSWQFRGAAALMGVLALGSIGAADVAPQEDGGVATPAAATADDDPGDDDQAAAAVPSAPALPDPTDLAGRDSWLKMRIPAIFSAYPTLAQARVGLSIVDVDSGTTLFEKDPDARFSLASNAKVMTSTTALAKLGPDFRWRTSAYADKFDPTTGEIKGDLFLRGRGDPTLEYSDLRQIAHDMYLAGVRAIDGDVVFDTSYFDGVDEPPHFDEQPKERAGFRAPIGAFAIEGDSIVVVVQPDLNGILPADVTIEPDVNDYVQVTLADVSTVTTGRTRLRVDTKLKKDHIELEVTGQIRADNGPEWIRRRIDDPVRMTFEMWKIAVNREQIRLGHNKDWKIGTVPLRARELAYHESAPLAEIVRSMMKYSNNYIAETLLKTLGAETASPPHPATWNDGLTAVRSFLSGDVGLTECDFRIENGSGLFGSTVFTPAQLTRVLSWAWHDFRVGPDLVAALPVMGVDGTTRRRLAMTPARGRARAKTGTLANVSTLTGFAAMDSDRPLAFAILVNDIPPGQRGAARALEDAIVEACVAYLGP